MVYQVSNVKKGTKTKYQFSSFKTKAEAVAFAKGLKLGGLKVYPIKRLK